MSDDEHVEDLWIQIAKNKRKYIIAGICRHPNYNINDFRESFEVILITFKIKEYMHYCR